MTEQTVKEGNNLGPLLFVMAGGTGGHVFPGLAVAKSMQAQGWRVEWFGTEDKIEASLVPAQGIKLHFLDVQGVRGKGFIRQFLAPFMLFSAVMQARRVLKKRQPKVVLGMGGFASGPGGIAAWSLGIPVVVHEQNAIFGMTNRWLAKVAKRVLCGFDVRSSDLQQIAKAPSTVEFVGNPVRDDFFAIDKTSRYQQFQNTALQDQTNLFSILIVGGSLGALALNQQVPAILADLSTRFPINVLHQAGKGKVAPVQKHYDDQLSTAPNLRYQIVEFIDDIPSAFATSDIIICRSGALTVAEVAAASNCAVFVPLPIAVDDHQTYNAKSLSDKGAAYLIQQNDLQGSLLDTLAELMQQPNKIAAMGERARQLCIADATDKVALACIQAGQG